MRAGGWNGRLRNRETAHVASRATAAGEPRSPAATGPTRRVRALITYLLFCLLPGLGAGGCAGDAPPAAPPEPDVRPVSTAGLPAAVAPAADEPGRVTVSGDHTFDSQATVRCGSAPAAGDVPRGHDLQIELDPEEPFRPLLLLTVPGFDGDGAYPATLSLRLDSDNGTFTESIGQATVGVAQVDAGVYTGSFTADYTGAAGEGEAIGRFAGCR